MKKLSYKNKTWIIGYLLILPFMIGFMMFYFLPYVMSLGLSFTRGVGQWTFVGLDNYVDLFSSAAFLLATKNTLVFTFTAIPLLFAVSLALACYLNDKLKKIQVFRSFFIMPLVLPTASVILFWQIIFADKGMINLILNQLNINEIQFLKSNFSVLVIIIIYVWKYSGYAIILFLSGLNSINTEYYENAAIDGATRFQIFWRITLPLLTPTAFIVLILSFINSLKIFREIYLLSGAYPSENLYMIQHFMNNNFRNLNYQRLTSASTLLSFIIIGIIFILYLRQRKLDLN